MRAFYYTGFAYALAKSVYHGRVSLANALTVSDGLLAEAEAAIMEPTVTQTLQAFARIAQRLEATRITVPAARPS
jgi:hypothetical protein